MPWEREIFYFNSDDYFTQLTNAIEAARDTVDIEMYIFLPDEMGRWLEDVLIRAAKRGVRVRLIIDGIGALGWVGAWRDEFQQAGVQLKIWNPVYTGPFWTGILNAIRKRGISRFFFNINRRTHRKYVVVDGELAFVGSQNIARDHVPKFVGDHAWRDTGLALRGDGIKIIERAFVHAWDRSYAIDGTRPHWFRRRRAPRLNLESPVRLNVTRRMRFRFWRDLIKRVRRAQDKIWLTTPYLSPTRFLLRSLKRASLRGCDVRILLPAQSDVFFMRWIQTSYYDFLIRNRIRVFEYQPTFLHAKSVSIDNWAMVGTTNMNTRSFLHDLEIDIVLSGDQARKELENQFVRDLQYAREIKASDLAQKAWMSRLGRWVSFFLRYWI